MKTKNFVLLLLILVSANHAFSNNGRIAVVADGNIKDPDDICATPISIALIAAFEVQDKLVHYSYSCHLETSEPGRDAKMEESLTGTATLWGGFDPTRFFNCQTQKDACIDQLAAQINASSSSDILWIIEAGEPDIIYYAMEKAIEAKRQYVRIVTHHVNNDKGVIYDLSDIQNMAGVHADVRVGIPDQNTLLLMPEADYFWMRDHSDSRLTYLWDRAKVAEGELNPNVNWEAKNIGKIDPSDAGMVYYWLTGATNGGDQACDVIKIKNKLISYIDQIPPYPNGQLVYSYKSINFNYQNNGFYLDNNSFTEPILAIDPDPNNTGTDAIMSGTAEHVFNGENGTYDIYFHGIGEKDGEAPIEIYVNSTKIGNYAIPLSALEWEADHKYNMTFANAVINNGDKIVIKGKTASNGEEWSRCRWLKVELYNTTIQPVWEEQNGFVIIEPEDVITSTTGEWEIDNSVAGYTGSGYIVWKGSTSYSSPTTPHLSFKVKINNPGTYILNWRNKVGAGTETSENNDTWFKCPDASDFYAQMNANGNGDKYYAKGTGKTPNPNGTSGDGFFKVYQYDANLNWTWSSKTGDHQNGFVYADFNTAGEYELLLAPRSHFHLIDRITMAKLDVKSTAMNLTTPKSNFADCTGCTPPEPTAEDLLTGNTIPSTIPTSGTLSFNIDYKTADTPRNLIVILVHKGTTTTTVMSETTEVDGEGTAQINMFLESPLVANDTYKFKICLAPTGGGWSQRTVTDGKTVTATPTATSIDYTLNDNEICIYPNPTKGVVYIKAKNKSMPATIINIMGQTVFEKIINTDEPISIANLPTGTYIIKLKSNGKTVAKKLTID